MDKSIEKLLVALQETAPFKWIYHLAISALDHMENILERIEEPKTSIAPEPELWRMGFMRYPPRAPDKDGYEEMFVAIELILKRRLNSREAETIKLLAVR